MVVRDIKYGGRPDEPTPRKAVLTDVRGRFVTSVEVDGSGRQLPPDGVGTPAATLLDLRPADGPAEFGKRITATQITANQNNYEPTGFLTAGLVRVSSDAARDITGFGRDGRGYTKVLCNVGAFTITLKHESGSSTANKRLSLKSASDFALAAGAAVWLVYDTTSDRWRLIGA